MGGSITGEHGVGMEKRDYLPEMFDPPTIEMMHRLRLAFDPKTDLQSRQNVSRQRSPVTVDGRLASLGESGGDQP